MTNAPKRELPGHIAAALAGAGGPADSAGRPWAGRDLSEDAGKLHNFEDDDGGRDSGYAAALADLVAGTGSESAVVESLAAARVFIPVIAELAAEAEALSGLQADKQADMALVTLKAPDGRLALPAFTSVDRLQAWHPEARPVAVYAARAALSAVAEGAQLMVLDPGADLTFVVRRPALWALARQVGWQPAYEDAEVKRVVAGATLDRSEVRGVSVTRGAGVASAASDGRRVDGGGAGPELRVVLQLRDGLDAGAVEQLVGELQQRWARDEVFAERVDSLEISVQRAER